MITNIEESRNKCYNLLKEANSYYQKKDYDNAEKLYLKICRISENIYCKTFLKKDSTLLIEYYLHIINFYKENNNYDFVQRWHQKLVGILQTSCENSFVLEDYQELMDWYIKTINVMLDNNDYKSIIRMSCKMIDRAKILYSITKTDDDLKYVIISNLYLGNAYQKNKMLFKSYFYYYIASKKLAKLYDALKDKGMRNDLINVYQCLYELSNHKLTGFISKRWKVKILLLKEEKNDK